MADFKSAFAFVLREFGAGDDDPGDQGGEDVGSRDVSAFNNCWGHEILDRANEDALCVLA
jgi:hypothetical protein